MKKYIITDGYAETVGDDWSIYPSELTMKKYLLILKLRIYEWLSFKSSFRLFRELTSNERGELARWITRNVTMSCAETLRQVRSGFYGDEDFG